MTENTTVALLALLGVALTTLGGIFIARRKSSDDKASTGFTQSFELTKYIRQQVAVEVAEQTKQIRTELGGVKRVLASLYDKYALVIAEFRQFYLATHRKLGPDTPPLDPRIKKMLEEDEGDTKTAAMMDSIRQSIRDEDETIDSIDE